MVLDGSVDCVKLFIIDVLCMYAVCMDVCMYVLGMYHACSMYVCKV